MMTITKTKLPENSILNTDLRSYHYVDSFQGVFIDNENQVDIAANAKAFFSSGSKWSGKLFALRNKVVSMFGLKTGGNLNDKQKQLNHFKYEPGEQISLFKVFYKTSNEVILGEDDKHLDFRVSLFLETLPQDEKSLTISTIVKFNNWFGRIYFVPVRPFHKIIVPHMLKVILRKIKEGK